MIQKKEGKIDCSSNICEADRILVEYKVKKNAQNSLSKLFNSSDHNNGNSSLIYIKFLNNFNESKTAQN